MVETGKGIGRGCSRVDGYGGAHEEADKRAGKSAATNIHFSVVIRPGPGPGPARREESDTQPPHPVPSLQLPENLTSLTSYK